MNIGFGYGALGSVLFLFFVSEFELQSRYFVHFRNSIGFK